MKVMREKQIFGECIFDFEPIDITDYVFQDEHINGERHHGVTKEDAQMFINNAFMIIDRQKSKCYFSEYGAAYIHKSEKVIGTAFLRSQYDEKFNAILKEYKNGN